MKAYFHNGWAKSLQTVVHFYNKRNIAVNAPGRRWCSTSRRVPRRATPRCSRLRRSSTPTSITTQGLQSNTPGQAQVGNLGLSASQEADLVNFLKILSDGFTAPNPVGPVGVAAVAASPKNIQ